MSKILIVEDDQIVANIYRNKFSVEGFTVEIASDGEKGFEIAQTFRPDAVILDLMLPKLTGVELMKRIRAEPHFRDIPVIVFSNTYLTNMVQEAWKAGATKCLSKANCSPKQVIEAVRSTLPSNGARPGVSAAPAGQVAGQAHASGAAAAASAENADRKFQDELRQTLVRELPGTLGALRVQLKGLIKPENDAARFNTLEVMLRRVHVLTGNAAVAGLPLVAQMSDAFEALLKELCEHPKNINSSTLRTVAATVDFLGVLFERGTGADGHEAASATILVVDDEAISRRAVTYALEKAKLKCVSMENPLSAYATLREKKFDLVFLDVDMPEMNGFELCTKLRTLPAYKHTPVVFVTSLNDLESRAHSTMSGGNDFIAKPFMFVELAVKALVYVLRARLTPPK
jgi:DNA-binding response OmpR family regulator